MSWKTTSSTGCYAIGDAGDAAIHNDNATLTVNGSTLSGNSDTVGGAILNEGTGTVTVSDSTLSNNTAGNDGGAINNDATLTVSGCTLSGNSCTGFDGGAIASIGTAMISGCTLSGNAATYSGGGIYLTGSSAGLIKGIGKYPIPVMVLARLAVDLRQRGQGLGKAWLKDAVLRTLQAADIAGLKAIFVQAKDEAARQFYEKCGLIASPQDPMHLFFPLDPLRK